MENNTDKKSLVGKILFVAGVVIILLVLAYLIITFVPRVFSGLANVSSPFTNLFKDNDIEVTSDATSLQDGSMFTIQWNHEPTEAGTYAITYECVDDVLLDIISDTSTRRLICENKFTLGPNVQAVKLGLHFDGENTFTDIPISIMYTETGDTSPSAAGTVVVTAQDGTPGYVDDSALNAGTTTIVSGSPDDEDAVEQIDDETDTTDTSSSNTSTTGTSGTSYTQTYTTSYVAGPADLRIYDVTGIGNQVVFTIANVGGRSTGNWTFNYTTPTNNVQVASSPLQISLAPGQAVRYTLGFNVQDAGTHNVTIAVDPTNSVYESNEANNVATVALTRSGGSTGGGNTGGGYNPSDDADFVIRDLEVGRLSGSRFTADDTADEGDDVAVRFIVVNRGGETTDRWRFEIQDTPFDNGDDFESGRYNGLRPGEYIEIIVRFEDVEEGDYDIEVMIDSEDDTDEESESNNTDSVELEVRD